MLDDLNYEVLGHIKLFENELIPDKLEEKSEYLLKENGLKTRSKLIFTVCLIPSKVKNFLNNFYVPSLTIYFCMTALQFFFFLF